MTAWHDLAILQPAGASVAALLALRLTGLVWTAPVLASRAVPAPLKAALTVVLVILLWPAATATAPQDAAVTVATVLSEAVVGITLGLGAAIFVAAAESAGDMLAVQMGLSGANVVNPMSETQLPVIGQFLGLFVTALLLAVGGHLVMLDALARSLGPLPVGAVVDFSRGSLAVVELGGDLLWLGLQFAAPVVAAMMIGNATLGILARTVPQLNVLMVAFPVQIGIGLFVLAATLPLIAGSFAGWGNRYDELASGLLHSFAPTPGGR